MKWIIRTIKILVFIGMITFIIKATIVLSKSNDKPVSPKDSGVEKIKIKPQKNHNDIFENALKEDKVDKTVMETEVLAPIEKRVENNRIIENDTVSANENMEMDNAEEAYFLTYDEILHLENLGLGDKIRGALLIRKLSGMDLSQIMKIANGGITVSESKELERLLGKTLSQEDMKKLFKLLQKNRTSYEEEKLARN